MTSLDFEDDEQPSHHDDDPSIASRSSSKQLLSQQSAMSLSLSSQHSTTSSSNSIRVKKSQTSVYAAQGAGESRMVQDDCGYYCSTILSGTMNHKSPAAVLQAAIELAALLSSKSTRAQLWKQDTTTSSSSSSILNAILTVLGAAAAGSDRKKKQRNSNRGIPSSSPKKTNAASSSSTLRTQSARRKLQQQSTSHDVIATNSSTLLADGCTSNNDYDLQLLLLRQALCCCLYFVSWDATLHKDHSVGSRRQRSTIALSRLVRTSILNHKTCLQGICQLTTTTSCYSQDEENAAAPSEAQAHDDTVPTSASASYAASGGASKPKRRRLQMKTFRGSSRATATAASPDKTPTAPPAGALDAMDFLDEEEASMSTKGSISATATNSNNSSMKPPPPRSTTSTTTSTKRMGDPTAQGRRNRRQRKRQLEQAQQLQGLVEASPSLSFASSSSSFPKSPPRSRKARLAAAAAAAGSPSTSVSNISSSQSTTTSSTTSNNNNNNNKDNLISSALQDKLEALVSRVELYPDVDYHVENDSNKATLSWCSLVALQALHRIVSGKDPSDRHDPSEQEEHDLLRLDDHDDTDTNHHQDDSDLEAHHDDDDDDEAMDNPILRANRALRNSGMLPILATSLMEALVEARSLFNQDDSSSVNTVHHRIQLLSTLLDGACLFDARNRTILCHDVTQDPLDFAFGDDNDDNQDDPASSCVVAAALALLEVLQSNSRESSSSSNSNHWSDIQLCCLRTLTSLSHENPLCASQIMAHHSQTNKARTSSSGLDVMAQIFYRLEETTSQDDKNHKKKNNHHLNNNSNEERRRFDASICCLNILANVLETGQVGVTVRSWMLRPLKTTMTSGGGKSKSDSSSSSSSSWLTWFSKWVVHKTESFRDKLVAPGSKRKHPSKDSEEDVPSYRDEDVVAAGNGCVLLACLLLSSDENDDDSVTQDDSLRTMILDEIPNGDVRFIINCMRAFCNFYAATVGQLSVAIVLPVQKLISQLEKEWGLSTELATTDA